MQGVDYMKTFSPMVKLNSINVLVILVIQRNLETHQLDVKTMFLNGYLDENSIIGITKCMDKNYSLTFLKNHKRKTIIGIVLFFFGIGFATCKISM